MDKETAIIDSIVKEYADASTQPGNFEATKKAIESFCAAENLEHSGVWHFANGMREVRAIDKDNTRRAIDLQYVIRVMAYTKCAQKLGTELKPEEQSYFDLFKDVSGCEVFAIKNGDWIYLNNPTTHAIVEVDGNITLSNPSGPAIEFADGSKTYAVDDVFNVPEWVVLTAGPDMDPKAVLGLENVDHRRIAIEKIGIERLVSCGKLVDEVGDRKLYNLADLFEGERAMYLSMINPSTGDVHVEGVDNKCESVKEARDFRAGVEGWNPLFIDGVVQEGGNLEQQQQGDVCFQWLPGGVPEDAPKLKTKALLSDENQKRHIVDCVVRGDSERQYLKARKKILTVKHPEHNDTELPMFEAGGCWTCWAVVEHDHVNDILRAVVD